MLDELIIKNLDKMEAERFFQPAKMQNRSLSDDISAIEIEYLKRAIQACRTTREMAAYVGTSQTTLIRKLKKYGLTIEMRQKRFEKRHNIPI